MGEKKFHSIIFTVILLCALFTEAKAGSKSAMGLKSSAAMENHMQYGVGFGNQNTKPGEVFKFTDFELKFQRYRELNEKEKKLKQESVTAGFDGGDSMLSPFNIFVFIDRSGNPPEVELSTLPYARYQFEINHQKFELRNSLSRETKWIIDVLK